MLYRIYLRPRPHETASLRDEESAVAWFYRMLRNAVIDLYRHKDASRRALEALGRELPEVQPGTELHAAICACVSRLARTLKPEYAAALKDVEVEGAGSALTLTPSVSSPGPAARRRALAQPGPTDAGDLRGMVRARRLSEATVRNIRQNLFFAFVHNVLGVPVAAGVPYPFMGLLLSPMIAAAAMSFSSVSVIANALCLRRVHL